MKDATLDLELQKTFSALGLSSFSANVLPVLQRARKAAEASDITVLIQGETGTGKQILARSIHRLDQKRSRNPFVTVHCSTISETLAESELFGHRRGSFSGASADRKGLFQAAQHGTIFLDDINDLPLPLQPKLLDVIQRNVVRPVGSDSELPIDVRIIAACNQPLEPLVRSGGFRSDLFHRLNVVKLYLPPLRERTGDFAGLMMFFAARYHDLYQPIYKIEADLIALLQSKAFPGNVRELENLVQRMLFQKSEGTSLGLADWMAQSSPDLAQPDDLLGEAATAIWKAISNRGIPYAEALQEIEKKVLETAIKTGGPTRRAIARTLHTSERTLYYKMRAHRLGPDATQS